MEQNNLLTVKKFIIILAVLLFSVFSMGQETEKIAIKTINKEKRIVGYLIVYIDKEHKTIKTIRVETFEELKAMGVMKKANGLIKHKDIIKDKLFEGEYLKNGAKK